MPNIATVLKEEVTRLARREVRRETASMATASGRYRHDIAALKRQVADLERAVDLLKRQVLKDIPSTQPAEPDVKVRFSPKGLVSQRIRLGLTAVDAAKILGVSTNTVHNWENGHTRPRKEQLAAIAALRGMGRREAMARLEELNKQPKPRRKS